MRLLGCFITILAVLLSHIMTDNRSMGFIVPVMGAVPPPKSLQSIHDSEFPERGHELSPSYSLPHHTISDTIAMRESTESDEVEVDVDENGNVKSITINDLSDPMNSGATASVVKDLAPEPLGNPTSCIQQNGDSCNLPQLPTPRDIEGVRSMRLGETIALDDLGPMVVNNDGTLRRITNWAKMTKQEQANTLRLITARNRRRMAALQAEETDTLPSVKNHIPSENDSSKSGDDSK